MSDFGRLSILPGYDIDLNTGEMTEVIHNHRKQVKLSSEGIITSSYSQTSIDLVRSVTAPMCEKILCSITGGRRVKKGNNKGFDIVLPSGSTMEAKMGRIGNSAVIKKNQLEFMDIDGFYGIVYYRTTKNIPPSYFTSQENKIGPEANLKRNIYIEKAFIIPQPLIVYFYSSSPLVEGKISSTGIKHKPLSSARALDLFNSGEGDFQREIIETNYKRHDIKVYTIGYKL